MYKRNILPILVESLLDTPVLLLQGARQVGKSTLAEEELLPGHQAEYFTLDDAIVLDAIKRDPAGFVSNLKSTVIIDEVQRVPELFMAIKAAVDKNRSGISFNLRPLPSTTI